MFLSRLKFFSIVLAFALLAACSNRTLDSDLSEGWPELKLALYSHYSEWHSVKYRWGGLSKQGIDCSGFVYLTFQEIFHIHLPRTTKDQIHSGQIVSRSELRTGDLVFFRTGQRQRHVGIYLEQRNFMHVSTRKGVTISSLDNVYWRNRYWKSVRILAS